MSGLALSCVKTALKALYVLLGTRYGDMFHMSLKVGANVLLIY